MRSLKKTIKRFGLILLIILALFGVGIGGGIPLVSTKKREDSNEINIEIFDVAADLTKITENKEVKP